MSVLVTGGAGYIGSHMVLELLDAGEEVLVLDNLSTGFRWAVPAGARFVEGDVGDRDLVGRLFAENDIDSIIHFAGSIVVPESLVDPLGYYLNNTCKSRALIACAVDARIPNFIFSSTAAVYGIPKINPVTEDAELQPISPYGNSKLMTEMMLRDTSHAHQFRFVALRYFNVAGADPKGRSGQSTPQATHLIKLAAETALGMRSHLDIYGTDYETPDGTCVRDYIHVTDLVRAHLDALRYLRDGGDCVVVNCGYGKGFSVLDVIEAMKRVSQKDFPVRLADRRLGDAPALVASAGKIHKVLGWEPRLDDLDGIVGNALSWESHLRGNRAT